MIIVFSLIIIFIFSFFLALRTLSELEIPQEIIDQVKQGKKPPKFWGAIIFLKGKIVHYSSSDSPLSSKPSEKDSSSLSSINSSSSSERIEE